MKIIWRDKSLPHQLDFRFIAADSSIQAYCNCGEILVQGRVVHAANAIGAYHKHLREVDGQKQ